MMARTLRDPAPTSGESYVTHANLLCGACMEFAVDRESDGVNVRYACYRCRKIKRLSIRWEGKPATEAILIARPAGKRAVAE